MFDKHPTPDRDGMVPSVKAEIKGARVESNDIADGYRRVVIVDRSVVPMPPDPGRLCCRDR